MYAILLQKEVLHLMRITDLYPDALTEDTQYEFKATLNSDKPVNWAKTLVAYANGQGGILFVGVSNDGEAFGITLSEIDAMKNLVSRVNDRYIFPHIKIQYSLRSVDTNAEKFVLGIYVAPSESVIRYKEGDFNEVVYVKGDGNTLPATPEDIISLSGRKHGIDNETSEILFNRKDWSTYLALCQNYREDDSKPSLKELQNEEIVSKDGFAKTGFLMFKDDYSGDDTLICCRLWKGLDKTGIVLDSAKFKGSLATVFTNVLNFTERNTKSGWKKTAGGGRQEVRSYPKEALREALVNAIAHRDYSIRGTQIDVDIYDNRLDIVSPGSWLLPKPYSDYPAGSIPSIRRNTIIAACLDVANLMERGGTGFSTMMECYKQYDADKQPGVLIYPGFLDLRLFDTLYDEEPQDIQYDISDTERILEILKNGPKSVKELQDSTNFKSRSSFLKEVINPLLKQQKIYRDGPARSPKAKIHLNSIQ